VNNQVDQASGTIQMKAIFENKDNALWPGLSVATRLLVETLKQVVVVPDDAVQRGPNGLYAFVVGDDNKVAVQAITVSQSGNGASVVQQGLTPGQRIVVAGQYRLLAGSLVEPKEAPATSAPAKAAENSPQAPAP
jgi:multidrug efflux system membrane fusion protein